MHDELVYACTHAGMYVQVHICMMYECLYVCMCVYVFIQVCILCICMYEVRTRMSRVRRHFCSRVDRSALPSRLSPAPRIPSPLNSLALSRLRASQVIDQRSLSLSLSLSISLSLSTSLSLPISLSPSLSLCTLVEVERVTCVFVWTLMTNTKTHISVCRRYEFSCTQLVSMCVCMYSSVYAQCVNACTYVRMHEHSIFVRRRHEFSSTKARRPPSDPQPQNTRRTDACGGVLVF